MFRRLRDGLFSPSSVAGYYGDKWWITLIFSIILLALYVAVPIFNATSYKYIPSETKSIVMNEAYGQEPDYKIVNGELKNTGINLALLLKLRI